MTCDCNAKVNEHLKQFNTELGMAFGIHPDTMDATMRVLVAVEKIDKKSRKPARLVHASFCPFCGESLKKPTPKPDPLADGGLTPCDMHEDESY